LLNNSALVYESQCGRRGRVARSQPNEYSYAHYVTESPNNLEIYFQIYLLVEPTVRPVIITPDPDKVPDPDLEKNKL
jgi:hypothetical protein